MPFSSSRESINTLKLNASAGNLAPDIIPIFKFAYNEAVPTAGEIDIWSVGGQKVDLSVAEKMVVTSTDALSVVIRGVDNDYNLLSETVVMDGVNPVTTLGNFLSVYSAQIAEDSPLINSGAITVTAEIAGTVQARIDANQGQTLMSHFVIPAGYTGFLITPPSGLASRNDDAVLRFRQKVESGTYITKAIVEVSESTPIGDFGGYPLTFVEKSWIKISGIAETNNTRVSSTYRLVLFKNSYLEQ